MESQVNKDNWYDEDIQLNLSATGTTWGSGDRRIEFKELKTPHLRNILNATAEGRVPVHPAKINLLLKECVNRGLPAEASYFAWRLRLVWCHFTVGVWNDETEPVPKEPTDVAAMLYRLYRDEFMPVPPKRGEYVSFPGCMDLEEFVGRVKTVEWEPDAHRYHVYHPMFSLDKHERLKGSPQDREITLLGKLMPGWRLFIDPDPDLQEDDE